VVSSGFVGGFLLGLAS